MSRKNTKTNKMVDAVSMASTITSGEVDVQFQDQGTILVEWSGTSPVGTITVQAKQQVNPGDASTWNTLDFNGSIDVSGNSGAHQIVFNSLPFDKLRLIYTPASGIGTMNATFTRKSIGA